MLAATVRLVAGRPAHPGRPRLRRPAVGRRRAPAVAAARTIACEGLGADLVAVLRRNGPTPSPTLLPEGGGWLLREFGGDTARGDAAAERRGRLCSGTPSDGMRWSQDPAEQGALWRIREEAPGWPPGRPTAPRRGPGWEDSAVPPEQLGAYLRDFDGLLDAHELRGAPVRALRRGLRAHPHRLRPATGRGVAAFREFMSDAADLVVAHGGSLSGEHGDGQARAELLPLMYGAEAMRAFAAFKAIWDPGTGSTRASSSPPAGSTTTCGCRHRPAPR